MLTLVPVASAESNEKVLYSFQGGTWTEKVLYGFKSVAQGKASGDGANPNGGLIFDAKGAIYGTTYFGGNNQKGVCEGGVGGTGCGTVFKLVPPTTNGGNWVEKILYRFKGGQEDGANPAANAVFSATGDLFGATVFGPQGGWGTIFEGMKPVGKAPAWTEKLLYRFSDGKDGNSPEAGLILDAHGNLYGTARDGNPTWGSAFRLDPPRRKGGSWAFTLLDGFTDAPDGGNPAASLILDKQSTLYGTTQNGGTGTGCQVGCGTVFEVSP
jgi:hypothetical protein